MKDTKFTAGPWSLWRGPQYVGGGEDICIGAGKEWIANMDHRYRKGECPSSNKVCVEGCPVCSIDVDGITEEQLANSHLIAAAPDMYAVLEQIAASLRIEGGSGHLNTIYAVLAKARGESA